MKKKYALRLSVVIRHKLYLLPSLRPAERPISPSSSPGPVNVLSLCNKIVLLGFAKASAIKWMFS
jgi:hypothetical protein